MILDGKSLAVERRNGLAAEIRSLADAGFSLTLAVVLVGDDPASQVYVRHKQKACQEAGIGSAIHLLPSITEQAELHDLLDRLSSDPSIHGILLQLPLPSGLSADEALLHIHPEKDVDGLLPQSFGRLAASRPGLRPCTPLGCIALLEHSNAPIAGQKAVVVGRSLLVGKPVAFLLLEKNATVTICHSKTPDLPAEIRQADILIAAIGRPKFIQGSWIKPGATVIDVGINRLPDGKLVGDVDFEAALPHVRAITPVPGGVGPMTIAMLLQNTLLAFRLQKGVL